MKSKYLDLLKRLVEAYEALPDEGLGRDDVLAEASEDEKKRLRDEVKRIGRPLEGSVFFDTWVWWEGRGGFERPAEEVALDLNILLERLDAFFGSRPIRAWLVSGDTEVMPIGERWWAAHAEASGRDLRPLSPRRSFPALQRGIYERRWMRASEWVRAEDAQRHLGRILEADRLRLGLCSLRGDVQTSFEGTGLIDDRPGHCRFGFRANGVVPNTEAAEEEIRECLAWAREEEIHVLAFPELCVPEACWHRLREEIARDPGALCLVIPGSYHVVDGEGRWTNAAPAWVVADEVREVARWEKLEPVEIATEAARSFPAMRKAVEAAGACDRLVERISVRSDVRMLATPFGVLGVAICRDALHTAHLARLLHRADHALILSMNESAKAYFSGATEAAGRDFVTAAFYVNAGQCLHDGNAAKLEMAFWRLPQTRLDGEGPSVRYFAEPGTDAPVIDGDEEFRRWPDHGRMAVSVPLPKNLAARRGG